MDEQQVVCPSCGHFNRVSARFCGKCGYDFPKGAASTPAPAGQTAPAKPPPASAADVNPAKEFCPACGKEVTPGARFCRSCGQDLVGAPVSSAAPPATPASMGTAPAPVPVPAQAPAPAAQPGAGGIQPAPAAPSTAQATDSPGAPQGRSRGMPGWLWAVIGLVVGILIGAGGVWAAPGLVGLAPKDAAATPDATPLLTTTPVDPAIQATVATTETIPAQPAPAEVQPPADPTLEPTAISLTPAPADATEAASAPVDTAAAPAPEDTGVITTEVEPAPAAEVQP